MTHAANQKLALMRVGRVIAAGEGIERGNPVHQAVFQQEIQRTVDGRRRGATAVLFAEHRQNVVGTQRFVALPDQFQHAAAQGGQTQPLFCAQRVCFGEGRMHAVGVVMGATGQGSIGHEQRRYWLETLLCYLFLTYMSDSSAPSFQSCCCSVDQSVVHRPGSGRSQRTHQYQPLQLIAAAVQDGVGKPEVLLPPGASPHNYALRPSDVRRVRDVELLYWIGPDMETFLPRVLQGRSSPAVAVQSLPGMHLRHFGEDNASHDDHAHHDEDADDHDHDHDHQPGSLDSHLWLSTVNARVIAAKMAADLSTADPANAARYASNAEAFSKRLDALDARIKGRVTAVAGKPFFVFHEAFDYFEEAYGLKHAGVFAIAAEIQPGAARGGHARAPESGGQDLRIQRTTPAPTHGRNPERRSCRSNSQSWTR